ELHFGASARHAERLVGVGVKVVIAEDAVAPDAAPAVLREALLERPVHSGLILGEHTRIDEHREARVVGHLHIFLKMQDSGLDHVRHGCSTARAGKGSLCFNIAVLGAAVPAAGAHAHSAGGEGGKIRAGLAGSRLRCHPCRICYRRRTRRALMDIRHFDRIGNGGLDFTELGFGTAPLGNLYRAISDEEAHLVLEAAWETGSRYYDTAPLYGLGLSETRLNRFLRGKKRDDYVLSTKVGRLLKVCAPEERTGIGKFFDTPSRREVYDYTYDGVMRSF